MGEFGLYRRPGQDAFDLMLIALAMTPAPSAALSPCPIGLKTSQPAIETAPAN